MSLHEQNIRDFSKLYGDRPELFTQEDLTSFAELKATFSEEDDIRKIADAIAIWCKDRPYIYKALLEIPITESESVQRGPGGRSTPVTKKGMMGMLENIVRTESGANNDGKSDGSTPKQEKNDLSSQSSNQ